MKSPRWLGVCMGLCILMLFAPVTTTAFTGSVAVGMEPVAVAARSNSETWVVNYFSDSISIVDSTINMGDYLVLQRLVTGEISF